MGSPREHPVSARRATNTERTSASGQPTARDSDSQASLLGHLLRRHLRARPAMGGPHGGRELPGLAVGAGAQEGEMGLSTEGAYTSITPDWL